MLSEALRASRSELLTRRAALEHHHSTCVAIKYAPSVCLYGRTHRPAAAADVITGSGVASYAPVHVGGSNPQGRPTAVLTHSLGMQICPDFYISPNSIIKQSQLTSFKCLWVHKFLFSFCSLCVFFKLLFVDFTLAVVLTICNCMNQQC